MISGNTPRLFYYTVFLEKMLAVSMKSPAVYCFVTGLIERGVFPVIKYVIISVNWDGRPQTDE